MILFFRSFSVFARVTRFRPSEAPPLALHRLQRFNANAHSVSPAAPTTLLDPVQFVGDGAIAHGRSDVCKTSSAFAGPGSYALHMATGAKHATADPKPRGSVRSLVIRMFCSSPRNADIVERDIARARAACVRGDARFQSAPWSSPQMSENRSRRVSAYRLMPACQLSTTVIGCGAPASSLETTRRNFWPSAVTSYAP